jgi:RecJ-like exonuclease
MCNGRGYLNLGDKCYACNGSGKCINCNGSGKIIKPSAYMTQIKENKLSALYKK